MAHTVSDNYRKVIYSGGAENTALLTIGGEKIDVSNIKTIIINDSVIDKTSQVFYLGSFVSKQIEITFRNANSIDLSGEVNLKIGTKVDGEWEYVPIGIFNIETSPEDYYKTAKITCLDNGVKFKPNVDISQFFDIDIGADSDGNPIKGITLENLLKSLCEHFLGENMLGTYPNVNRNMIISSYDSTIGGKRYISWIAELMASNAKLGRDGKLYLEPIKRVSTATIDVLAGKSLIVGTKYHISGVRYDNGVVIPSEFGDDTFNVLNIRVDNMLFGGDDETRNSIVENIYNSIKDLEIWNIQTENYGDLSLDSFDIVTYNIPEEEKSYTTFYTYNITYEQVIMSKVNTEIPSKQVEKTTNVIKDDTSSKIRKIETEINQVNNTLRTTITETLPAMSDNIKSNYTEIMNNFGNYVSMANLSDITNQVNNIISDTYTKTEINQIITGRDVDGNKVTYVNTESGIFDSRGLTIDRTGSQTRGRFNQEGLFVIRKDDSGNEVETILSASYNTRTKQTEVVANNLVANNYIIIDNVSRFQNYMDNGQMKTGCFWINNQKPIMDITMEDEGAINFTYNSSSETFIPDNLNNSSSNTTARCRFTFNKVYYNVDIEVSVNGLEDDYMRIYGDTGTLPGITMIKGVNSTTIHIDKTLVGDNAWIYLIYRKASTSIVNSAYIKFLNYE